MATEKVLVITSGGDAPGMNAAIRACVRMGLHHNFAMYGCESGFQGLLKQHIFPMDEESVANCIQRGGTILKTARSNEFKHEATQQQCRDFIQQQNINAVIILGGNGSFQGALQLAQKSNLKVIGIPCTIDNDITGTEYCIGFDTACNTALNCIDRVRDTALSHERKFIIEVMGRNTGFLAVEVGIAGGAEFIITPEFPVTADELIIKMTKQNRKKLTSIIVAAESDQPGHTIALAAEIKNKSNIDYKTCVLGHIQRGGTPSTRDRVTATKMGILAIEAIKKGISNQFTAELGGKIVLQDFPTEDQATRTLKQNGLLLHNQIIAGIPQ
jgi:6-phosphofructokinase 1